MKLSILNYLFPSFLSFTGNTKEVNITENVEKTYPQEQLGKATWYGHKHHGKLMANGKRFDMWAMTCASNTYPLGSRIKVTNTKNGKSIIVKVTDTGGFKYPRIVDLSFGAFKKIAKPSTGVINVKVELLQLPKK